MKQALARIGKANAFYILPGAFCSACLFNIFFVTGSLWRLLSLNMFTVLLILLYIVGGNLGVVLVMLARKIANKITTNYRKNDRKTASSA